MVVPESLQQGFQQGQGWRGRGREGGLYPAKGGAAASRIQIFVHDLQGTSLAIQATSEMTVEELKMRVYDRTGVAAADQRLLFQGRHLGRTVRQAQEGNAPCDCGCHSREVLREGSSSSSSSSSSSEERVIQWLRGTNNNASLERGSVARGKGGRDEWTSRESEGGGYDDLWTHQCGPLEEEREAISLGEYGIKEGSTVHLSLRLKGGLDLVYILLIFIFGLVFGIPFIRCIKIKYVEPYMNRQKARATHALDEIKEKNAGRLSRLSRMSVTAAT